MLFNILALISVLICITLLKRLVAIYQSLLACIIRWKESVNLEASVKLSNDRDRLALSMFIPFCLVADATALYRPAFLEGLDENLRLAIIIGIFMAVFSSSFTMTVAPSTTMFLDFWPPKFITVAFFAP